MNTMRELRIAKVVLNIGVGEAGDRLSNAETVLQKLTDRQPVRTLSRTTEREVLAQRVIAAMCVLSAAMLFALHHAGGELWGSRNVARPFAVVAVIVALASMMNIKGKDVQGETNPHAIMKRRREEE